MTTTCVKMTRKTLCLHIIKPEKQKKNNNEMSQMNMHVKLQCNQEHETKIEKQMSKRPINTRTVEEGVSHTGQSLQRGARSAAVHLAKLPWRHIDTCRPARMTNVLASIVMVDAKLLESMGVAARRLGDASLF